VVTGFTAGIAVVIFSSQLGDLFGLSVRHIPVDAIGKLLSDAAAISTFNPVALLIAGATLGGIVILQKFAPRVPAFLIALVLAGGCVWFFKLPVVTIGTRFGGIPSGLPAAHLPVLSMEGLRTLLPAAFTIFALGGIESLLSATVADGMTGRRHRANCELAAQGIANVACAVMGGIPATGAIARTAANIRAGARTPVSGIVHSVAILAMMALFAPLASSIPLAALAAILTIVCWNMAEPRVFGLILQGAPGDRAVLIATFLLTIFVDLSFAIATGVVLASLVFARNMAGVAEARRLLPSVKDDIDEFAIPNRGAITHSELPPGVEIFQLSGPLFFAAAAEFEDILSRSGGVPKVLILRMAGVSLIDATGASALHRLIRNAQSRGTATVLCELNTQSASTLRSMDILAPRAATVAESLVIARSLLRV
jgi:SulP family sulfate permease